MALVVMVPSLNSALNLSVDYVLACGLVCLGFSAISNIYANYRGIE
jgi:uncharacterized membrane protein YfcA